jgi:signal peptidase I
MAFSFKFGGGEAKAATPERPMTATEEAVDLAKTIVYAVAIALVLRVLLFQPFNIPSGSMKPTLQVGDFLFVSKPTYGYSRASLVYPLTRIDVKGRIFAHGPARGDIVVFKVPRDGNKDYIKRVVGLPGDEISVLGGVVHINGAPIKKESLGVQLAECDQGPPRPVAAWRETMPEGASYTVYECEGDDGAYDNVGPYRVPLGHYFMMGDNRDRSQDSRVGGVVGYVPLDDIVGRAERIFFSVDGQEARIWEIWKWPFAVRYGRLLDSVR